MQYGGVVVRPHGNVAKAPRFLALIAFSLALTQSACDRGSSLTPTQVSGVSGANSASTPSQTQAYRLYGRIHDRWQGSLIGAKVELISGPDSGAVTLASLTQYPILYEFQRLRSGTYVVRASREGFQTREVPQDITDDTELNIQLETIPVPPQRGFFEGWVTDLVTGQRLDGVLVEALRGAGAGLTTTTNGAGLFWFDMPPGATTFRWSKPGYSSRESDYTIAAGAIASVTVALQPILPAPPPFPPPPYTVTGTVTDSRRNPVPGAEVWVYGQNSPIDNRYATGLTDGAGRYTLQSPQRAPQQVRAQKAGYIPRDVLTLPAPVVSNATATWTVDVALQRIVQYRLLSPTSVKVGQSAVIEAQADLDDGTRSIGFLFTNPTSSDPSVAQVDSVGRVRGVAPGTATITASYYGVSASIQVRVDR